MLILSGFKAFWREKKNKLPYFWSAVASSDEEMDLMSALEWFKLWMTIFIPPMSQKRMALSIYKNHKMAHCTNGCLLATKDEKNTLFYITNILIFKNIMY